MLFQVFPSVASSPSTVPSVLAFLGAVLFLSADVRLQNHPGLSCYPEHPDQVGWLVALAPCHTQASPPPAVAVSEHSRSPELVSSIGLLRGTGLVSVLGPLAAAQEPCPK